MTDTQEPYYFPQPTEDQTKQVEFLHDSYLRDFGQQDNQYKDLMTKTTFLFGFSISVLTLYATYATNVNPLSKILALGLFGVSITLLCFAFCNRVFHKPARLDAKVAESNYFSKVYQEVTNIKQACLDNDYSLFDMAKYVRWSIYAFTAGVVALIMSFII